MGDHSTYMFRLLCINNMNKMEKQTLTGGNKISTNYGGT